METSTRRAEKPSDLPGRLILKSVRTWERALEITSTGWCLTMARLWGIEVGSRCRFLGAAYFRRMPGSAIRIGNRCRFRSAARWTSQVGITRPCCIQTLRQFGNVVVGDDCGFSGTVIAAAESIVLGQNVLCGANVTITDTDWHFVDPGDRQKPFAPAAPVVIENNVWLGMNVVVLKGVTIGENSVIAPLSVVTRSIPAGVLAGGQPAAVLRDISTAEK